MKRVLLMILLSMGLLACSLDELCEECPECPECPDTLDCPDGYTLEKSPLKWECKNGEEPPPPPEVSPADYYRMSVGEDIIHKVDVESRSELYLSIWSGVRDEEFVASKCGHLSEEVLMMSSSDLIAMGQEGRELIKVWDNHFRPNFQSVNRRCQDDGSEWCRRTNVKKVNWHPIAERIRTHRARANLNRKLGQEDPLANCLFDSVKGWCQCRLGNLPFKEEVEYSPQYRQPLHIHPGPWY